MTDVNKVIGLDMYGNLPGLTGLTPPSPALDLGTPPKSIADVVAPSNSEPIKLPSSTPVPTPTPAPAGKAPAASTPVKTGGVATPKPAPAATPAPTPAPAKPFTFNGFYAQRMKENGGYLKARDLKAEQEAVGNFGKAYGRMPKSSDDWKLVHNALYGGTQFMAADAADALDEAPPEAPEEATVNGTEEKFGTPTLDEVFTSLGIEKLKPTDYTADYERINQIKENRLQELSYEFAQKRKAQSDANKQISNTLKAKLIKMGVPLDSSSFISADQGQETRNKAAMDSIDREEARQRALIEKDAMAATSDLSIAERTEAMNVNIQNINNVLQGYDLAKNIWTVFINRDENEKKMEQDAKDSLMDFQTEMMKLDQSDREMRLGMIENFLTDGMYDMQDGENVKILQSIEKQMGLEPGELINAGVGGYNKRLSEMALKEAQTINTKADTEQKIASTQRILTLLPEELAKMRAQTAKLIATRSGSGGGGSGGGSGGDIAGSLKNIETWFSQNATGGDGRIDSGKYLNQLNGFVNNFDPKLKNEKYWKTVFFTYFPPNAALNPDKDQDPIAANLNRDFEATLKNPDSAGFDVNVFQDMGDDSLYE